MNAFSEFKQSFKFVKRHPILLLIQFAPLSLLLLQAYFTPAVLNPIIYHELKEQDAGTIYALNALLFMASYMTLIIHNIYARDKKINLKLALKHFPKVLIGGLIIASLYVFGAYLFMIPSILAVALFLFYNQEIIFKNKGITSSFKGSITIFKNNLRIILNLLAILFGLSIINWIPYGIIINYFIQPCVNITVAKVYLKKFMQTP